MDRLSFNEVGVGVGFLMLCLLVIVQIATLLNIRRQQKREDEFATKAEIARVDNKVDALRSDVIKNGDIRRISIEGKVETVRKESLDMGQDIRGDLTQLSAKVAELKGETTMIVQALARMEMKGGNR